MYSIFFVYDIMITYSQDGRFLVSGDKDFAVRVWDAVQALLL